MNTHTKPRRQRLSLDEVDPYSDDLVRVTSPRSLEAVQKRGLTLRDLRYVPKSELARPGQSPEVAEAVYRKYEETRLRRLREVSEERQRLLEAPQSTKRFNSRSVNADFDSVLESMRQKELRRLQKLELKKTKELIHVAAVDSRLRTRPSLMKDESRELRSAQPTPPPRPSQLPRKLAEQPNVDGKSATTAHKRGNSQSPMNVYENANNALIEMKRKLEARARLLEEAKARKASIVPPKSESPEALNTSSSKTHTRSYTDQVDAETRERRRQEHLAALEAQRQSRKREKERTWKERFARLQQLEAEGEQWADTERKRLQTAQHHAMQRFQLAQMEKEKQINVNASKEVQRIIQSKQRRDELQVKEALRVSRDYEEYTLAERKSEEIRLSRVQEAQNTGEIRSHHRDLRYLEAQRLRRVEDYQRMKTLEKINEENEFSRRLQSAKAQELQLKQRLRKQLETEKRVMAERFEKLTLIKGPQLMNSLKAGRPISMSPSLATQQRRRKSSLTPSPAPPPRVLDYSTSEEHFSELGASQPKDKPDEPVAHC